ncbi:MAG: DUF1080 domain-containing protein [Rikenellaceae bacterium]|jgi:hypothetical protein|nr:DUF1080 domain-containing protein [Rikenellaceae bacterium]
MRKTAILALLVALPCFVAAQGTIELFNGKNLKGWKLYLVDDSKTPEEVFTADKGVINIAGQPFGCMYTEAQYSNYKLEIEWRWPEAASNSGIFQLVNFPAPEGENWPYTLECQLAAGKAGDVVHLGGAASDANIRVKVRNVESVEKPVGEWNKAEIICIDGNLTIYINGTLQNEITGATKTGGSIGMQSEGGPVQFRNITLTPLNK